MTEASIHERILRHPLAVLLAQRSDNPAYHVVGGTVRDAVLSVATDDLDISVSDQGGRLASSLAEESRGTYIALGGDRFSSHRVIAGVFQADIWDREGGSLAADLERRDLTINSIACTLDDDRLRDPFGGLTDLGNKTLRATKADCFERDPLRVLRLARFRTTLGGFTIDRGTAVAARAAATGLERTAVERIRDELQRILSAASTGFAFETLAELGALAVLLPEAYDPAVSAVLLERADQLDRCLDMIGSELSGISWKGEDRITAAAALLLSVHKSGVSAAGAAGAAGVAGASDLERQGVTTRRSLRAAIQLLTAQLPRDEDRRRLFILAHGPHWPLALAVVAATTPAITPSTATPIAIELEKTARANPALVHGPICLLDGHAAARILGIAPGPAVGEALRALGHAQALGRVTSRNQAEEFLRRRKAFRPTSGSRSGAD